VLQGRLVELDDYHGYLYRYYSREVLVERRQWWRRGFELHLGVLCVNDDGLPGLERAFWKLALA
jgi:hypothetical protein